MTNREPTTQDDPPVLEEAPAETPEEVQAAVDEELLAESPTEREIWTNRFRYFLVGVAVVCIAGLGYLVLTRGVSSPTAVTVSSLTPTYTATATVTLTPTATPRPPTETPTPGPSPTPLPPYHYRVGPGDTWLGLAIEADVSLESLLTLNSRLEDDFLKLDEEILIPWPTYTPTRDPRLVPTLERVEELESDQCREHVISAGETLFAIALKYEVSAQLLEQVNGITNPDLLKQGQTLCIPLVTPGPPPSPTFGPSPTPEDEPLHPAPQLLYPPAGAEIPAGREPATLQWTVVGWLDPDESYMVEIRSLSRMDARVTRGFAQVTMWTIPETVYPGAGTTELFSWRVSVVRGEGESGSPDYRWERSGLPSDWQVFTWTGVARSSTPTPTQ
jgi:LysM repeat protein